MKDSYKKIKRKYDSSEDTLNHIRRIIELMNHVTQKLSYRAYIHDRSKLVEPEKPLIDACPLKLSEMKYNSPAYKRSLEKLGTALKHHYAVNKHHPQYWEHGVNDMSLLDVIEMLIDWKSATERVKDGDIYKSIKINQKRFGLSDQLVNILENTAKEMGW
jgi:hypothetical protein